MAGCRRLVAATAAAAVLCRSTVECFVVQTSALLGRAAPRTTTSNSMHRCRSGTVTMEAPRELLFVFYRGLCLDDCVIIFLLSILSSTLTCPNLHSALYFNSAASSCSAFGVRDLSVVTLFAGACHVDVSYHTTLFTSYSNVYSSELAALSTRPAELWHHQR